MTILLVAIWSFIVGVGLAYLMLAGIIRAERLRAEGYPIPVCAPSRHNALTGAYQTDGEGNVVSLTLSDYQEQLAMDERLTAELNAEIDELERDAHEYRQEIRRLRDELAELRFPVAPVATTASRYSVIDKFAYLEVQS